jgi:hypothetical protein
VFRCQVTLGADHPIPREEHLVDHTLATTTLCGKQMAAIPGGNAARSFGMNEGLIGGSSQITFYGIVPPGILI